MKYITPIPVLLSLTLFTILSTSCFAVQPPSQAAIATAGNVDLCWNEITTRTDDTPMVVNRYMVFYGLISDSGSATAIDAGTELCTSLQEQPRGQYHAWVWPVDEDGVEGELSNERIYSVGQFRPSATILTTQID